MKDFFEQKLKLLVIVIKELSELVIRRARVLLSKNQAVYIKSLHRDGLCIEPDFYTAKECENLRRKIDKLIEDESVNSWVDQSGSDHRIYFANELDHDFEKFYTNARIRSVLAGYTGTVKPNGMLLAARIDAKEGNIGSGGGWHRDSPVTNQFKAICYLSDVNKNSGPFQYIKRSHKKVDVLKTYFSGIFKAGQYRFTEHEIEHYLKKTDHIITEFIASEGTLAFADTKGLHRGKPLEKGSRYVLFCYFWHGEIPTHFEKLRQSKYSKDKNELL